MLRAIPAGCLWNLRTYSAIPANTLAALRCLNRARADGGGLGNGRVCASVVSVYADGCGALRVDHSRRADARDERRECVCAHALAQYAYAYGHDARLNVATALGP